MVFNYSIIRQYIHYLCLIITFTNLQGTIKNYLTTDYDLAAYAWENLHDEPQQYSAEKQYGLANLLCYIHTSKDLLKLATIIESKEKAANVYRALLDGSKSFFIKAYMQLNYVYGAIPSMHSGDNAIAQKKYWQICYGIAYRELAALAQDLKAAHIDIPTKLSSPGAIIGSAIPSTGDTQDVQHNITSFLTTPDYQLVIASTMATIMIQQRTPKDLWKSNTGTILYGALKKRNEFILKMMAKLTNIMPDRALYLAAQQGILQGKLEHLKKEINN